VSDDNTVESRTLVVPSISSGKDLFEFKALNAFCPPCATVLDRARTPTEKSKIQSRQYVPFRTLWTEQTHRDVMSPNKYY
jgi:hypothetical protein